MGLKSRLVNRLKPLRLIRDRRAAHALEMALVYPVFLLFLLFLFEVAYGQFVQAVLDSTTQFTAYQMQVGATTNTASGQAFVDNDLCPNAIAHILGCNNLYVRIQKFDPTACADFSAATSGTLPVASGKLGLADYVGESAGTGGAIGPTSCGGTNTGFCNPGPNQYIIMSVIYVGTPFLGGLIPGTSYSYNGSLSHAVLATSAFYTEGFAAVSGQPLQC